MSGVKTSKFSFSNFLRQVDEEIGKVVNDVVEGVQAGIAMVEAIDHTRKENRRRAEEERREKEQEQRNHQDAIKLMKGEIRELAEKHQQAMEEQQEAFEEAQRQQREDMLDVLGEVTSLKDWTKKRLKRHDSKFEAITKRHQGKINQLEKDVRHFIQQEQGQEQRASDFIAGLALMMEEFQAKATFQKFAPYGIQEDIQPILDQAQSNYQNRDFQSALARSQDAFLQLNRLDQKVFRQQMDFDGLYMTTLDAVTTLLAVVRERRNMQLKDSGFTADMDYWTRDAYSHLEKTAEALQVELETERKSPDFTIEKVQHIFNKIQELDAQRLEWMGTVVERVFASQRRAQMADLIVKVLGSENFSVLNQERGFEGDDQRNSYLVKLKSMDGTELVVVIRLDEATNENILSINTYNEHYKGERARHRRWEELQRALEPYVKFEPNQAADTEEGIAELSDIRQLLKKGSGISEKTLRQLGKH